MDQETLFALEMVEINDLDQLFKLNTTMLQSEIY
jgi:hypothetical protein